LHLPGHFTSKRRQAEVCPLFDIPGTPEPGKPDEQADADVNRPVKRGFEKKALHNADGHNRHHYEVHGKNQGIFYVLIQPVNNFFCHLFHLA
jgi:hypothetical protein